MRVHHGCCEGFWGRAVAGALIFFFFNDPATPEIYTLSLHDALPIYPSQADRDRYDRLLRYVHRRGKDVGKAQVDRKSTRLNSSHGYISYAVFCLKKKKQTRTIGTSIHHWLVPPIVARACSVTGICDC